MADDSFTLEKLILSIVRCIKNLLLVNYDLFIHIFDIIIW